MSERKTIIRTVGLKKHYTVGGNTVRALDGVDMSVLQGEFVCVAGRSGSGKSTMLNMLAGLEPPTEGEIIVRGKHHLEAMDEEQRTRFRRRYIGFVFQSYNNLPQYTALENVALPLAIRGVPEDERNWLAWQALSRVGLRGHVDHRPSEPSLVSSSASVSPVPLLRSPPSCWRMSPPAIWTAAPVRRSWSCCVRSSARGTPLLFSAHMIHRWRVIQIVPSISVTGK